MPGISLIILFFPLKRNAQLFFFSLFATNLEYRGGEKEKVGGRPAKRNEKKVYRGLEREKTNRGDIILCCWKNTMKIL